MTSDPYAKAQSGEKLTIHATAWNRLLDTVRPNATASPGEEFSYASTNFRVNCHNDSGDSVPQWGILRISDVLLGSSGAAAGSWSWPGVVGASPQAVDDSCVVAVEPIAVNGIGQAAVAGVVQARVRVNCTGHRYASPRPGQFYFLDSSDHGPFRILWIGSTAPANPTGVSGANNPWAILMFDSSRPMSTGITGYSAGDTQLLGHGKAVSGASSCDAGFQWYSVTECPGNPSYAASYFL